jgi:uncharacterized protein (DUF433 family)
MPTNMVTLYGGKDPRETPNYSIREVADYLGVPRSTVRWWVKGKDDFKPVISIADPKENALSFLNLVEVHVLSSLKREGLKLPLIRRAIQHLEKRMGVTRPLAREEFQTDGVGIFVSRLGKLIEVSGHGQTAMEEMIKAYLRRVDYGKDGLALRLYPFTRRGELSDPRAVVFDPHISFGRLVLANTGIPTEEIADRFNAGDTIEEIAADFSVSQGPIQEAIRCEFHLKRAA